MKCAVTPRKDVVVPLVHMSRVMPTLSQVSDSFMIAHITLVYSSGNILVKVRRLGKAYLNDSIIYNTIIAYHGHLSTSN